MAKLLALGFNGSKHTLLHKAVTTMSLMNPIIANLPTKDKPASKTRMSNSCTENNFQHGPRKVTLIF